MAEKHDEVPEMEPEQVLEGAKDAPGTSGLTVTSTKGKKTVIVKLEMGTTAAGETSQINQPEILAFRDRPIEHLEEAALREYEVEGEDLEPEYDNLTEEDVNREVEKLAPEDRAHFLELKHLLTIQGCVKGRIPRISHLINAYVTGRFPGIPSDTVAEHVEEEGREQQDIQRVPKEEIDAFVEQHDRRIPRRQAIVRPGRQGVTLSIDPYGDTEVYTIDEMEDKVVETIVLTDDDPPRSEVEKSSETTAVQQGETIPQASEIPQGEPSTSKAVITDVITEDIAKNYVVEDPDKDDVETISSTSTADYDRDDAEDLVDKIATCHTNLAKYYEEINKVVPHMSKTQLALYLGKVPVIPLVKPEAGHVTKMYVEEKPVDPKYDYEVRGHTWEEKLDYLVKHVPAEHLLFAIAIGDMQVNQFSQAHIAFKYGYAKTRIQRALSHNPEHRKGGRQYQQERKRKGSHI